MISLERSICQDFEKALGREWLETNGLGGFACGTVAGANTRRYHGLLTAAMDPPGGRVLLLSKLEETLIIGGQRIDLSCNEYGDTVTPRGYEYLVNFRLGPFPVFAFDVHGVGIEKSVFMLHQSNTTQVEYRLLYAPANVQVELEARPLIAFRDYHATTHENPALNPHVEKTAELVSVAPYPGLPRLYMAHNADSVGDEGYWYRNFLFRLERERGLDCEEDLFSPLVFRWNLGHVQAAVVIASTQIYEAGKAAGYRDREMRRRGSLRAHSPASNSFVRTLSSAADQFLVKRNAAWTVVAGYPWFIDWGRDTMIALPGLTLYTGNHAIAKEVLRNFSRRVDMGMLPNRFVEAGETPEFNTVDAALWLIEAARAYSAATGDDEFVRDELYSVFSGIIDWHVKGTRYNIRMTEDGLLDACADGVQLTWMDAKIDDWVVTPRSGKPVEIQALWFNALRIMDDLARRFGHESDSLRYAAMARTAQTSFGPIFWNSEKSCLYDVIREGASDASIRPNQILAASLPYTMLTPEQGRSVVDVVERELLTPCGLRTLSPADRAYIGQYTGDRRKRDSAYHQGTVWPWLLGPFITAYVRVHGGTAEARQNAESILRRLEPHLREAGLGQISEIFEGDPPHRPRGCFAQAWSVAEVLRALCEDVYQIKSTEQSEAE